jgi:hypothetical protein
MTTRTSQVDDGVVGMNKQHSFLPDLALLSLVTHLLVAFLLHFDLDENIFLQHLVLV